MTIPAKQHKNEQKQLKSKLPQKINGEACPLSHPQTDSSALLQRIQQQPATVTTAEIQHLQRTVGNQAISKLFSHGVQKPFSQNMPLKHSNAQPIQRVQINGAQVNGGLAAMQAETRLRILKEHYKGSGEQFDLDDVGTVTLEDADFAQILKYGEVNALQDELDQMEKDSKAFIARVENVGNNVEGMPRPMDLAPPSPAYSVFTDTLSAIKQLNEKLTRSRTSWGDAHFPRTDINQKDALIVDLARDQARSLKVDALKAEWEDQFSFYYDMAKELGVESQIAAASNAFVVSLLDANISLYDASSAFSNRLNELRDSLISDANLAGDDQKADKLSVGGKAKSKAIFENLMVRGSFTLKANAIYRSEFEKGQWDFGAEWLINTNNARWQSFVDNWVLHGHLTANVPSVNGKGDKHDFDRATFVPKILHVKPIAHREDTGWSETVAPIEVGRLDPQGIKKLTKEKSVLFNTVDKRLAELTGKYFTTSRTAVNSAEAYRDVVVAQLIRNIISHRGGNPNETKLVEVMSEASKASETEARDSMIKANQDFVVQKIGGGGKTKWLKRNVAKKVSDPLNDEFNRISDFLVDVNGVKDKDHYKVSVLDQTKEATEEKFEAFEQATDELDDLAD